MAKRKLTSYVHIDGAVYGPDNQPPADVAQRITNPNAWGSGSVDTDPESEGSEPGSDKGYSGLTVKELKAEIEKRNEGRAEADQLSVEGNKPDLVAALEADDNN